MAPSLKHFNSLSTSFKAVKNIIGIFLNLSIDFIVLKISYPFISGILISSNIKSGVFFDKNFMVCIAEVNKVTL